MTHSRSPIELKAPSSHLDPITRKCCPDTQSGRDIGGARTLCSCTSITSKFLSPVQTRQAPDFLVSLTNFLSTWTARTVQSTLTCIIPFILAETSEVGSASAHSEKKPEWASWITLAIYPSLGILATVGSLEMLPAESYHQLPVGKPAPKGVLGTKGQSCSEKPQRSEAEVRGQRAAGWVQQVPFLQLSLEGASPQSATLMSPFKDWSRIIALLSSPPYTAHTRTHILHTLFIDL